MARKASDSTEKASEDQVGAPSAEEARAASIDALIEQVRQLLDQDQAKKALDLVGRSTQKSDRLTNAAAVCQIRLGQAEKAVELLRPVVVQGYIHLREGVPAAFKLTFAAALLGTGNLDGFLATLHEIPRDSHPSVARYEDAYRRWKASRPILDRLKGLLGAAPSRPFAFDFPAGELL